MAHGNYNCCAICDIKLEYSENPKTKNRICEGCLKQLQAFGLNIVSVSQLIEWIENNDINEVSEKLGKLGFQKCYYGNDIDKLMERKGIKFDKNGNILSEIDYIQHKGGVKEGMLKPIEPKAAAETNIKLKEQLEAKDKIIELDKSIMEDLQDKERNAWNERAEALREIRRLKEYIMNKDIIIENMENQLKEMEKKEPDYDTWRDNTITKDEIKNYRKSEFHQIVMKIDAIGSILRGQAARLLPIQINHYGKEIMELTNRLKETGKAKIDARISEIKNNSGGVWECCVEELTKLKEAM